MEVALPYVAASVYLVLLLALSTARRGWTDIASLWLIAWIALLVAHAFTPYDIVPASGLAILITTVGISSFVFGVWLPRKSPVGFTNSVDNSSTPLRFASVYTVTFLLFGLGYLAFRRGIEGTVGRSFTDLTLTEVRYAQNYMERTTDPTLLLFSLASVVACLGIDGAIRYSRAYYLTIPVVLYLVAQSPARTHLLSVVVTAFVFYLLTRRSYSHAGRGRRRRRGRPRLAIFASALVVLLVSFGYFQYVGASLGKLDPVNSSVPVVEILRSPVVYFTGGVSALTVAIEEGQSPGSGSGKTIYVLYRVASLLGVDVSVPETISGYVNIPEPFNVYTGFGDVWFDFGFAGLCILYGFFGFLLGWAISGARRGSRPHVFAAALLLAVAASTSLTWRLFALDTVFTGVVGALVFAVSSPAHNVNGMTRFLRRMRSLESSNGLSVSQNLPSGSQ